MKKIVIISATSETNFLLAQNILKFLNNHNVHIEILNIENYKLPLFNPSTIENDKKKCANKIKKITDAMLCSNGIIICAPEYNGNVPPVLSNAIAWISVTTSYWKDGFKNKNFFIASSSGGDAEKFQQSMQLQLEHLGANVFEKKIIINSSNKSINIDQKNDLKDFLKLL